MGPWASSLVLTGILALAAGVPARLDDAKDQSQGSNAPATKDNPLAGLQVKPGSEAPIMASLDRGLAFLAKEQARLSTGALPSTSGDNHAPIGVTSLAALAWIGGGSSLTRGPYHTELTAAIDYLLASQVKDGPAVGYFSNTTDQRSQTHGHGLATLALAQAFTISPRSAKGAQIKEALRLACDRIIASQGVDGGWYYDPKPTVQQEGSVTVALVWALRGAKDAGIFVDAAPIHRAIAYVKTLQDESGGFMYSASRPRTSVALTAAALSTLHATGTYDGAEIDAGYDYIWRSLTARELKLERGQDVSISFPFYERLYLAQALYQHKDLKHFTRWSAAQRAVLLRTQEPDGHWPDERFGASGVVVKSQYGPCYATAVNCLFLTIPHSTLPIFMR
ncbi:MAG: terpene cyclase/mutase family protein [Planctomycetota bacterium]|nr:terpene cyclase/mutase family protein [Planctomycetota bacterium]